MLLHPAKARPGDRIAVVSPSFAAPGIAPAVHEQALGRLADVTGLVPVEYPTTRLLGASPEARAADLNAAFADPDIRAIITTIGGDDQITVIPHLDADAARRDPKPFLGYSDNTNLHQWLCGATASPPSMAAQRRSIWDRDRESTTNTPGRCAPLCSREERSN